MESSIFFGGSVVAAVVAGMLALFAPCCISFMLPAYFASSFQNRLRLVAMTCVFAAGVATVILPIALGASMLRQLFAAQHSLIYIVGGMFLLGLAIYLLLGGQIHLPMPGRRTGGRAGILTTYTLGIFSGITSSCCAPVLAGVIALSSVAPTFWLALGLGIAYVFGMVVPLFIISLLWEYYDWKTSRIFHPRIFTWHFGSFERTTSITTLASGLLLLIMGSAMIWVGVVFRSMPPLSGWQAWFVVDLQQIGRAITGSLGWLPNWIVILALVLFVVWLTRRAAKQVGMNKATDGASKEQGEHSCAQHTGTTDAAPENMDDHVYTHAPNSAERKEENDEHVTAS